VVELLLRQLLLEAVTDDDPIPRRACRMYLLHHSPQPTSWAGHRSPNMEELPFASVATNMVYYTKYPGYNRHKQIEKQTRCYDISATSAMGILKKRHTDGAFLARPPLEHAQKRPTTTTTAMTRGRKSNAAHTSKHTKNLRRSRLETELAPDPEEEHGCRK
jgi:hypothetical protein